VRPRTADIRSLPWESARVRLAETVEDVVAVLTGGWRTRDQSGAQVRDIVIDTAVTTYVEIAGTTAPLSVELLRAVVVAGTTGTVLSGGSVTWSWRSGLLEITACSALAAATRYNATILVRE
jgi:hypothetical protein